MTLSKPIPSPLLRLIGLISIQALCVWNANAQSVDLCPQCTTLERTHARLQDYKDIAETLEEINKITNKLPDATLRYYYSKIGQSQEVDALLGIGIPERRVPSVAKAQKPPKKKTPRVRVAKKPVSKGLDGLVVGHAQIAVPAIGFKASAILSSHGKPVGLGLGPNAFFKHNGTQYRLAQIDQDQHTGSISVVIINEQTKQRTTLPWSK